MKDEAKSKLKSSMDILLSDLPDQIDNVNESDVKTLTKNNQDDKKYVDLKDKSVDKAKKTINAILKFYVAEDIIENEDYVKAKVELNNASLGTLMYLMETTEKAINSLLQEILDNGDKQPRMYEVLTMLQKTQLDILKSQTTYILDMEEMFKKMSRDIEIYSANPNTMKKIAKKETISVRGTKDLMKAIRGIQNGEDEENEPVVDINIEE